MGVGNLRVRHGRNLRRLGRLCRLGRVAGRVRLGDGADLPAGLARETCQVARRALPCPQNAARENTAELIHRLLRTYGGPVEPPRHARHNLSPCCAHVSVPKAPCQEIAPLKSNGRGDAGAGPRSGVTECLVAAEPRARFGKKVVRISVAKLGLFWVARDCIWRLRSCSSG